MKTQHQQRIEKFMLLAGQEVKLTPELPDEKTRLLRAKLILEEALETINALGISLMFHRSDIDSVEFIPDLEPDIVKIADGCADISVVTIGTLSACGIHDSDLIEEIDRTNLEKFGPGGYRREDGKWIKPKDWKEPEIKRILDNQTILKMSIK